MPIKNRTTEVIDSLVIGVAAVGVLGLTIVAPNSLVALEKVLDNFLTGRDKKREAQRIAKYLKQRKLVSVEKQANGDYRVTLRDSGKKRSQLASFERLEIPTTHWDGKWRIIMFDIPERYKPTRDYISRHLKQIGFKQLQRSVFVFPYPADTFIAILKEIFPEIAGYVYYLTAEEMDQHNRLVKSSIKYSISYI